MADLLVFAWHGELEMVKETVRLYNLDIGNSEKCCDYDKRTPM